MKTTRFERSGQKKPMESRPASPCQREGGWTTATLLLDVYGHFLPTEYTGYADALSRPPNAPYTHPEPLVPADTVDDDAASSTSSTGFRLEVGGDEAQIPDHAQESQPEHGASGDTDEPVGKERSEAAIRKRAAKQRVGTARKKKR